MAYDKAVDSAQLEAALTATANAIREKAGNTDTCAWDASTGFASLIAAIQAGGGGSNIITESGVLVPAEDQTLTTINTNVTINSNPSNYVERNSLFLLWKNDKTQTAGSYLILFYQSNSSGCVYTYGVRPSGSVYNSNTSSTMTAEIKYDSHKVSIDVKGKTTANYTYGLVAGVEYGWAYIFKGEVG